MQAYSHSAGFFTNKDKTEIFHQKWTVQNPGGALFICHGLGEHSGRYTNLLQALSGQNISIYAIDHAGHGKSGGRRGHIKRFTDYCDDINMYIMSTIKSEAPDIPLVMLGHSMGGLIAAAYGLAYPDTINGLVLSSAAFIPSVTVPAVQKAAAKLLARIVPWLPQNNKLNPDDLSSDRQTVEAYVNDPLVHTTITVRWFAEFVKTTQECMERAGELAMPLLVFHGSDDAIVSPEGSRQLYEKASSADKTLKIFDGLRHETMNETPEKRAPVLELVTRWIKEHTTT